MKMNCVPVPRCLFALASSQAGRLVFVLIALVAVSGCQRDQIEVYTAPKDKPAPQPVAQRTAPARSQPRPQVLWVLPEGWVQSGPSQLSVASFSIKGSGDAEAQVTITPLTRLAGRDAEIVNMWREQVGLDPLSREDAAKEFQPVQVGGELGNLFEISGAPKDGSSAAKIITAMVHRSDASWFYKLSGDAALVDAQKPVFIKFLQSVQLKDAPAVSDEPVAASGTKPNWIVPAQWKEIPAGQMQLAKFAVPERGAAKAEVSISTFPSDTGGTLANVNRWRKQIGLPEAGPDALASMVSPLDASNPDAVLVNLANNNRRILGAIVPRGGTYWFYKLMGDDAAVAPEKDAFVAFAKSKP